MCPLARPVAWSALTSVPARAAAFRSARDATLPRSAALKPQIRSSS